MDSQLLRMQQCCGRKRGFVLNPVSIQFHNKHSCCYSHSHSRRIHYRYLHFIPNTVLMNRAFINKAVKHTNLALAHFDGLYSKVYGRAWPSMRLGLLSSKKHCAVFNSFTDTGELVDKLKVEANAIDLQHYYRKHLISYTRWQLRQQLIHNKKLRKRELLAKNLGVSPQELDTESIEVSDVSDNELNGTHSTDADGDGAFSSAEDLQAMFTDRRMDDDDKYFINRASTKLNLNDFVPSTELIFQEEQSREAEYYDGYSQDEDPDIEIREEPPFEVDNQLKILCFPRNDWSRFDNPSTCKKSNLFNYYLMDGASLLPVLALDLRHNDICADYCAAPGGKSLAMLMTLKPKYILCNDVNSTRLGKLAKVFKLYAPSINYVQSTVNLLRKDAKHLVYRDTFDKILVDVPCSNDRSSVESLEGSLFARSKTETRLALPSMQKEILVSALKSLKPGGCVVYSTCTMSPIENDGVVQRALLELREEKFPSKFVIMNLKEAFRPLRGLIRFNTKFKYGQQVVPNLCSNFGPMYISKIKCLPQ